MVNHFHTKPATELIINPSIKYLLVFFCFFLVCITEICDTGLRQGDNHHSVFPTVSRHFRHHTTYLSSFKVKTCSPITADAYSSFKCE